MERKLYLLSPLQAEFYENESDRMYPDDVMDGRALAVYGADILQKMQERADHVGEDLMEYYDEKDSVKEKVTNLELSVVLKAGELMGCAEVTIQAPLTVYGRMFKLYMYTAIAPIPIATFAGEPTQNIGKNFVRSYAGVCMEGAIIALACIIFSVFAASPPAIADSSLSAVNIVWNYVAELIFNLLVLVGAIKAADRIVKEIMGL